jgi:hypothetical protein
MACVVNDPSMSILILIYCKGGRSHQDVDPDIKIEASVQEVFFSKEKK